MKQDLGTVSFGEVDTKINIGPRQNQIIRTFCAAKKVKPPSVKPELGKGSYPAAALSALGRPTVAAPGMIDINQDSALRGAA
jgi:hypothetical protein